MYTENDITAPGSLPALNNLTSTPFSCLFLSYVSSTNFHPWILESQDQGFLCYSLTAEKQNRMMGWKGTNGIHSSCF